MPLATQLTMGDLREFRAASDRAGSGDSYAMLDWFVEYFSRYIPKRVVDSLTQDDVMQFMDAWSDANDTEGLSQGE